MNSNIYHPTDYFNNDPSLRARPCIFFVEGNDDGLFISEVLKNLKVPAHDAGIIKFGGMTEFGKTFNNLKKSDSFTQGRTKSIAIIFDSDSNSAVGKKTINAQLQKLLIDTTALDNAPLGEYAPLYEEIYFGLFALPMPSETGTIETLCLKTVEEDAIAAEADKFISSAQNIIANLTGNRDKRKAQVYLAGRSEQLCAGVGMGCVKGIFDTNHAAMNPLREFIKAGLQNGMSAFGAPTK